MLPQFAGFLEGRAAEVTFVRLLPRVGAAVVTKTAAVDEGARAPLAQVDFLFAVMLSPVLLQLGHAAEGLWASLAVADFLVPLPVKLHVCAEQGRVRELLGAELAATVDSRVSLFHVSFQDAGFLVGFPALPALHPLLAFPVRAHVLGECRDVGEGGVAHATYVGFSWPGLGTAAAPLSFAVLGRGATTV